ncbi:MAG TPA: hypothetical protein VHT21_15965 [Stellaceae bacterium]|nr:hypothetical protein [Stellaceae bacterium]
MVSTPSGHEDRRGLPEPYGIAEQMAHGPPRIGKRRLGWTVPIEPGAQDAGDRAVMRGGGGEQGGPLFERSILDFAVIDRRVVAQGRPVEACGDAARTQIGFGRGAGDGTAGAEKAAGRFRRCRRCGRRAAAGGGRMRQDQKAAGLGDRLAETRQIAVKSDQVEQIAVLAGGGIGLMFNCT